MRALMRIARDDEAGALSDAEHALELAPHVEDPQSFVSVLAHCGHASLRRPATSAVRRDVLETLLRRCSECRTWVSRVVKPRSSPGWSRTVSGGGARARGDHRATSRRTRRGCERGERSLAGDLRGAADVLAEIGAPPSEAFFRLRAAEALVAEGRRAEADEQLRPALAFYRGVGATRYVREGEALLAASA